MKLNLEKPIVVFDLETTGVNLAKDRIVEIFMLKILPNGEKEEFYSLVNPKMPIPQVVIDIHGIDDAKVANAPSFMMLAHNLLAFIENCDLAGFNSNYFDIPLLQEELYRVGLDLELENRKSVDIFKIFTKMEPRNLGAAVKFYCNKELEDAHSAKADVYATYDVFVAQLDKYDGKIANNIEELSNFTTDGNYVDSGRRFSKDKDGNVIFNFGKHKGKLVEDVLRKEPMYYDWMMRADFLRDTKQKLTKIKENMKR